MEKTIHVRGCYITRNGKVVYRKAYTYRRECKEPRVVAGISKSHKHNVEAVRQLDAISRYSDKQDPEYQNVMRTYPDVAQYIAERRVPRVNDLSERLRRNIRHAYNMLF